MHTFLGIFAQEQGGKKRKEKGKHCCQPLYAEQLRKEEQRPLILCQGIESPPAISLYQ